MESKNMDLDEKSEISSGSNGIKRKIAARKVFKIIKGTKNKNLYDTKNTSLNLSERFKNLLEHEKKIDSAISVKSLKDFNSLYLTEEDRDHIAELEENGSFGTKLEIYKGVLLARIDEVRNLILKEDPETIMKLMKEDKEIVQDKEVNDKEILAGIKTFKEEIITSLNEKNRINKALTNFDNKAKESDSSNKINSSDNQNRINVPNTQNKIILTNKDSSSDSFSNLLNKNELIKTILFSANNYVNNNSVEPFSNLDFSKFNSIPCPTVNNQLHSFLSFFNLNFKEIQTNQAYVQLATLVVVMAKNLEENIKNSIRIANVIKIDEENKINIAIKGEKGEQINRKDIKKFNKIEQLKKENKYINEEEWKKLTTYQKTMKRFIFADFRQNPYMNIWNKFSNDEKLRFCEAKKKWRNDRVKMLNNLDLNDKKNITLLHNFNYYEWRDPSGFLLPTYDLDLNNYRTNSNNKEFELLLNKLNNKDKERKIKGFIIKDGNVIMNKGRAWFNNNNINNII